MNLPSPVWRHIEWKNKSTNTINKSAGKAVGNAYLPLVIGFYMEKTQKLKNISFDAKVWTAAGRCPKKVWWHGLAEHGWIDSWFEPCEMYWASNTYGIRKLYLMAFVMLLFVENWDVAAYRLFQWDFSHGSWWQMCPGKNGRDHMTSTYHLLPKRAYIPMYKGVSIINGLV